MNLSRYFNALMASALGLSMAVTPFAEADFALAQNAPAAEGPADMTWQKDFEAWRSASKSGKVADYQSYLRAYPAGKFASVARKRIDELNGTKTADVTKLETHETTVAAQADTSATAPAVDDAEKKKDIEMWREVSKTGKTADYERYLRAFPKGRFAKVAKTRIASLSGRTEDKVETADAKPATTDAQTVAQAEDKAKPANDTVAQQSSATDAGKQPDKAKPDWEQEYALWKAASDGNTIKEYQAYLKAYPEGKFAGIAQSRIAQLTAAEQPATTVEEGDDSQAETVGKVKPETTQQNEADTAEQQDQQPVEPDDQSQQADQQDQQMQAPDDQTEQAEQQNRRRDKQEQQQADDQAPAYDDQSDQAQMNDDQADDGSQPNVAGARPMKGKFQFTAGAPDIEDQYLDREGRHEIQGRLTSLGYDTFGSDGAFGPNTRTAIAGWQQDNGAPTNGYLSDDQIAAIREQSQDSYRKWLSAQAVVVRPHREKIIVEERYPDAAIAAGVIGTVVGVETWRRHGPRVKWVGKVRFKNRWGGCRRKRRC